MTVDACYNCLPEGFCKGLKTRLVTRSDIQNPDYVRDLRNFMASLCLTPGGWYVALGTALVLYPGIFVSRSRIEVSLTILPFEKCDYHDWLKAFTRPVAANVAPHVRKEALGRVIVLASILKAYYPVAAATWGVRPADMDTQAKATASVWHRALSCPVHKQSLIPIKVRDDIFARR